MNKNTKVFALAVSALMIAGALIVFVPSDDSVASDTTNGVLKINDSITFNTQPITQYESYGLWWNGTSGKMDNLNLVHNSVPTIPYGHTFHLFELNSATFEIVGNNTITVNYDHDSLTSIDVIYGNALKFTGSGTLNIVLNLGQTSVNDDIRAFDAQNSITFDGCRVTVTVNDCSSAKIIDGLYSYDTVKFVNASYEFNTSNISCPSDCAVTGIGALKGLSVTDSRIDIKSITTNDYGAYGISIDGGDFTVSQSVFRVKASTSAFNLNSSVKTDIDGSILGINNLNRNPGYDIELKDICDYKVVWINKPISASVFGISMFLVVLTGILVAAISFLRKD